MEVFRVDYTVLNKASRVLEDFIRKKKPLDHSIPNKTCWCSLTRGGCMHANNSVSHKGFFHPEKYFDYRLDGLENDPLVAMILLANGGPFWLRKMTFDERFKEAEKLVPKIRDSYPNLTPIRTMIKYETVCVLPPDTVHSERLMKDAASSSSRGGETHHSSSSSISSSRGSDSHRTYDPSSSRRTELGKRRSPSERSEGSKDSKRSRRDDKGSSSSSRKSELQIWLECSKPSTLSSLTDHEYALVKALTPRVTDRKGKKVPLCWHYLSADGCQSLHLCPRYHDDNVNFKKLEPPVKLAIELLGGSKDRQFSALSVERRRQRLADFREDRRAFHACVNEARRVVRHALSSDEFKSLPADLRSLFETYPDPKSSRPSTSSTTKHPTGAAVPRSPSPARPSMSPLSVQDKKERDRHSHQKDNDKGPSSSSSDSSHRRGKVGSWQQVEEPKHTKMDTDLDVLTELLLAEDVPKPAEVKQKPSTSKPLTTKAKEKTTTSSGSRGGANGRPGGRPRVVQDKPAVVGTRDDNEEEDDEKDDASTWAKQSVTSLQIRSKASGEQNKATPPAPATTSSTSNGPTTSSTDPDDFLGIMFDFIASDATSTSAATTTKNAISSPSDRNGLIDSRPGGVVIEPTSAPAPAPAPAPAASPQPPAPMDVVSESNRETVCDEQACLDYIEETCEVERSRRKEVEPIDGSTPDPIEEDHYRKDEAQATAKLTEVKAGAMDIDDFLASCQRKDTIPRASYGRVVTEESSATGEDLQPSDSFNDGMMVDDFSDHLVYAGSSDAGASTSGRDGVNVEREGLSSINGSGKRKAQSEVMQEMPYLHSDGEEWEAREQEGRALVSSDVKKGKAVEERDLPPLIEDLDRSLRACMNTARRLGQDLDPHSDRGIKYRRIDDDYQMEGFLPVDTADSTIMISQMRKRLQMLQSVVDFIDANIEGGCASSVSGDGRVKEEDKNDALEHEVQELRARLEKEKQATQESKAREVEEREKREKSEVLLRAAEEALEKAGLEIASLDGTIGQVPSPKSLEEPPFDMQNYSKLWHVWESFLVLQKNVHKDKGMQIASVNRNMVLKTVQQAIGDLGLKGESLHQPLSVKGFDNEDLNDDGGGLPELYSLYFEQLKSSTTRAPGEAKNGREPRERCFRKESPDGAFLPFKVPPSDSQFYSKRKSLRQFFRRVGKVFAKAIIDNCPIPTSFAPEFLISYFLNEEPNQERVPIPRLVRMLVEIDPCYSWVKTQVLSDRPFEDQTVGGLLNLDDPTPITLDNWESVFRRFFIARVVEGREWQLQQMREGFREGHNMVADFLELFPPGMARRRLISGEAVTRDQLLGHISFDADYKDAPKKFRNQPKLIAEALKDFTDEESWKFWRMATGLNSIPEGSFITFVYKNTVDKHPTFSTCYRQVFMPGYTGPNAKEEMLMRLRESIHQENLPFDEG